LQRDNYILRILGLASLFVGEEHQQRRKYAPSLFLIL
jgi:hypothetical protein